MQLHRRRPRQQQHMHVFIHALQKFSATISHKTHATTFILRSLYSLLIPPRIALARRWARARARKLCKSSSPQPPCGEAVGASSTCALARTPDRGALGQKPPSGGREGEMNIHANANSFRGEQVLRTQPLDLREDYPRRSTSNNIATWICTRQMRVAKM